MVETIGGERLACSPAKRRMYGIVLFAGVGVGVILRWMRLGRDSLWFDEGYTAWVVSLSPMNIVRAIRADTSPPIYYLILHFWTVLFGHGEWGLRSFSAVCSTITLLFCYPIARRLLKDDLAAVGAMCLFAVSYMPVAYSHEARFYAFSSALVGISFYFVLLSVEKSSGIRVLLIALIWIISVYTANVMVIYVACMGMAWLILPGVVALRRRLIDLGVVGIVVVIAFVPWLPTARLQMQALHGHFWVSRPDGWMLLETVSALSGVLRGSLGIAVHWLFAGVVIVLFGVGATGLSKRVWRWGVLACGMLIAGPVMAVFVLSRISQPVFIDRIFLAATLFIPMLLGFPLANGFPKLVRVVAAMVMLMFAAFSVVALPSQYLGEHPEPWREACAVLPAGFSNDRLVIFVANEGEMLFDYYRMGGRYGGVDGVTGAPADFFAPGVPRTLQRVVDEADVDGLRLVLSRHLPREVYLVEAHTPWADPELRVRGLLMREFELADDRAFGEIHIWHFRAVQ